VPTAKEVVGFLKRNGYREKRQSGSHLVLQDPASKTRVVVPMHAGDLPKGLLHRIIKDAGFTMDYFREG
jgi:mRNA interferase HicA